MRKIDITYPASMTRYRLSVKSNKMASELQEQRMLNSELVRVCSRQQQIIEQQSQMIVEMLEQMGR